MVAADHLKGFDLIHDPRYNKGTAFTDTERDTLGLRGLLPPRVFDLNTQIERVLENVRSKPSNIEKYIYMIGLQDRNETLFYRVVMENLEELVPILYTPTVGQACQEFGHIWRRPRGLYVSIEDRGRVAELINNWPEDDVRVVVMTDGERILGLGDLGAHGMGIPVGKLSLYTACAGIHPAQCLPVTLDVGTDREAFQQDPLYIGMPHGRVRGEAYDALIEEFITALRARYPRALIQFEDFGNQNAFRLLAKYRERIPTFNDDIQGTAAVTLAGLMSALNFTGGTLSDQKFLFLGAGEAGIGIGDLIVSAMMAESTDEATAKQKCWFVDSKGLVVASRDDLAPHKLAYAHEAPFVPSLAEAVTQLQPTAIIGVSGMPAMFTEPIVREMATINERPIVFALSNPTANSECTAAQAYEWSGGRAVFASGSPFPAYDYQGQTFVPGQANNAYIFPGLGLGIVVSGTSRVTDAMFSKAAAALASLVGEDDLAVGRIYPALTRIREVSAEIAYRVAALAFKEGLATVDEPDDLRAAVHAAMYTPEYHDLA